MKLTGQPLAPIAGYTMHTEPDDHKTTRQELDIAYDAELYRKLVETKKFIECSRNSNH